MGPRLPRQRERSRAGDADDRVPQALDAADKRGAVEAPRFIRWPRADPDRLADVSGARRARPRHVRRAGRGGAPRPRARGRSRGARLARGREAAAISSSRAERLRARRPDVVYAHFLVPSGLIAALGTRAPLVVTAHGRDVRNIGWLPGIRRRDGVRRATRGDRDLRLRVPAPRARDEAAGGAREDGGRVERRRPRAVHGRAGAERAAALPLRRRARGAQERRPARGRVRAARRGHAHVRRRRPAARAARRPRAACACSGRVPHDDVPTLARRGARALPAEPDRAARPGAPRGARVRPLGRRDADRRPAGVRAAGRRRPRRPARRRRARGRARARRRRSRVRTRRRVRPPRRTTSGTQAARIEAILSRAAAGRRA